MPRTYKPKNTKSYSEDDIKAAVTKVKVQKKTIYSVAKEFKIPRNTLRRWVLDPPHRFGSGRNTVLTIEEEILLVDAIKFVSKCGFPQSRTDIRNMVNSFIAATGRKTPFTNGKAGLEWMRLFERRHGDAIKRAKPENLSTARSESLTKSVVDNFFNMYEKLIEENNFSKRPHCIFDLDETGLNTNRIMEKLFFEKESRHNYVKSPNNMKTVFTVLFCVSATGVYLPPYIIYKSKYLYDKWTEGGPVGTGFSCSDSGWMKSANFESWFVKVFVKYVENFEKPVLLMYDGHTSHMTYITVKTAIDNNIIILCLPPNTTHAMQPLDVGVFKNCKLAWKQILNHWYKETRLTAINKDIFPNLVGKLWSQLLPEHAILSSRK